MEEALQRMLRSLVFGVIVNVALCGYIWLVTRRRHLFLKMVSVEQALWLKLGLSQSFVDKYRRFVEGKTFVFMLWLTLSTLLSATGCGGAVYLHYKAKHDATPKPVPTREQPAPKPGRAIQHTCVQPEQMFRPFRA